MKHLWLALLLISFSIHLQAEGVGFSVFVQNLAPDSGEDQIREFSPNLFQKLNQLDSKRGLNLRYISDGRPIRTQLEATSICEREGLDLMIFGQVSQNLSFLEAEVKIYDHGKRQIIKTMYGKVITEDSKSLVSEVGLKIFSHFKESFLLPDSKEEASRSFSNKTTEYSGHGLGYWWSLGDWAPLWVPVISYSFDKEYAFGTPIWSHIEWALFPALGGSVDYRCGFNQPSQVSSQYYSLSLGFLAALTLEYQKQINFHLGLGPLYRVGFLLHKPLYEEARGDFTSWVGIQTKLNVTWWLDGTKTFGFGLGCDGELFMVQPLFMEIRPYLQVVFRGDL